MLPLHVDPSVYGNAGNVAFGPRHVLYNSSSHRIAKTRNDWDCSCLLCDLQDELMIEPKRYHIGLCLHHAARNLLVPFRPTLGGVLIHDQVLALQKADLR